MDDVDMIVITSMEQFSALPLNDQKMLLYFGRFAPPIARFPHCIFRASRSNIETLLSVVTDMPGWYGGGIISFLHLAPHLAESLHRTYPDLDDYADYIDGWKGWHDLWALPEMQEIIKEYACRSHDNFNMLIDIETDEAVLNAISFSNDPHTSYGPDSYLDQSLPLLMDELKWAYILLEEDSQYTLFVTSHRHAAWVNEVKDKLLQAKQEVVTLQESGGRFYWQEEAREL